MKKRLNYDPKLRSEVIRKREILKKKIQMAKLGRVNKQIQAEENFKPIIDNIKDIKPLLQQQQQQNADYLLEPLNEKQVEFLTDRQLEWLDNPPSTDMTIPTISYKATADPISGDMPVFDTSESIAAQYLGNYSNKNIDTDKIFGPYRKRNGDWFIGQDQIKEIIHEDGHADILLGNGDKYIGTEGFWELLTLNKPDENIYTDEDLENYKIMILRTNAYLGANGRVKSSRSYKYKNFIQPILIEAKRLLAHKGSGLKKIYTNQTDYKYWNDPKELIDRLRILLGLWTAGNHNPQISNEITNIVEELEEAAPSGARGRSPAKILKRL